MGVPSPEPHVVTVPAASRRRAVAAVRRDLRIARAHRRTVRRAIRAERDLVLRGIERSSTVDEALAEIDSRDGWIQQQHFTALATIWADVTERLYESEFERITGLSKQGDEEDAAIDRLAATRGARALQRIRTVLGGNVTTSITGTIREKSRQISATARARIRLAVERQKIARTRDLTNLVQSLYRTRLSRTAVGRYAIAETLQATAEIEHRAALSASARTGHPLVHRWVTVGDSHVRDAHARADGQTRPIFQPFTVGGEYLPWPRHPSGSPGNVINCRCWEEKFLDPSFRPIR